MTSNLPDEELGVGYEGYEGSSIKLRSGEAEDEEGGMLKQSACLPQSSSLISKLA